MQLYRTQPRPMSYYQPDQIAERKERLITRLVVVIVLSTFVALLAFLVSTVGYLAFIQAPFLHDISTFLTHIWRYLPYLMMSMIIATPLSGSAICISGQWLKTLLLHKIDTEPPEFLKEMQEEEKEKTEIPISEEKPKWVRPLFLPTPQLEVPAFTPLPSTSTQKREENLIPAPKPPHPAKASKVLEILKANEKKIQSLSDEQAKEKIKGLSLNNFVFVYQNTKNGKYCLFYVSEPQHTGFKTSNFRTEFKHDEECATLEKLCKVIKQKQYLHWFGDLEIKF